MSRHDTSYRTRSSPSMEKGCSAKQMQQLAECKSIGVGAADLSDFATLCVSQAFNKLSADTVRRLILVTPHESHRTASKRQLCSCTMLPSSYLPSRHRPFRGHEEGGEGVEGARGKGTYFIVACTVAPLFLSIVAFNARTPVLGDERGRHMLVGS